MAVGILLCTYVLEQWVQTQDSFFVANTKFTNVAVGMLIVLALGVRAIRRDQLFKPFPPVGWAVLALLVYAIVSVIWSPYSGAQSRIIDTLPYFIAFGLLMPFAVSKFEDVHASAMTLLFLGTALVLLAITTTDWDGRGMTFQGSVSFGTRTRDVGSPLAVATLAGNVAMIVVLLNFTGINRFWQLARWGVVALGFYVALKSNTRGQVFAMLIAGLSFIPLSRRIASWRGFFGTIVAIGFVAILANFLIDYMVGGSERWSAERMIEVYGSSRVRMSADLLSAWVDAGPLAWVFGLGYAASYDPTIIGFYPHIVLVEALGELGIIGFAILWLVVFFVARSIYRLWPVVKDYPEARGVVAVLGAMFFFEVILSFKQGTLLSAHTTLAFAVMLGRLEMNYVPAAATQQVTDENYDYGYLPDVALPNLNG
ncbi:MAG: hypothetical protein AAGD32_00675 [Planctomycetota bacterium]